MAQIPLLLHAGSSCYAINSIFRAASFACSQAAGSVSVTPRATTSRPSLITSQYQWPSSPLGMMRNSTPFPIVGWVLRPEMIIGVDQDTLYCAALRAHEGRTTGLGPRRKNISPSFPPPAAPLAGRV